MVTTRGVDKGGYHWRKASAVGAIERRVPGVVELRVRPVCKRRALGRLISRYAEPELLYGYDWWAYKGLADAMVDLTPAAKTAPWGVE